MSLIDVFPKPPAAHLASFAPTHDLSGLDLISRLASLTPRQRRVLHLVRLGRPNRQIAADLRVSESTVKAHVSAFLKKLKFHSRTQAVVELLKSGSDHLPALVLTDAMMAARIETLTRQEMQVMHLVCAGHLNKQIGHLLQIKESTVKAHVSAVLRKLGLTSRTQVVVEISKFNGGDAGQGFAAAWGMRQ